MRPAGPSPSRRTGHASLVDLPRHGPSGRHARRGWCRGAGATATVPLRLRVWPLPVPAPPRCAGGGATRTTAAPYGVTARNRDQFLAQRAAAVGQRALASASVLMRFQLTSKTKADPPRHAFLTNGWRSAGRPHLSGVPGLAATPGSRNPRSAVPRWGQPSSISGWARGLRRASATCAAAASGRNAWRSDP